MRVRSALDVGRGGALCFWDAGGPPPSPDMGGLSACRRARLWGRARFPPPPPILHCGCEHVCMYHAGGRPCECTLPPPPRAQWRHAERSRSSTVTLQVCAHRSVGGGGGDGGVLWGSGRRTLVVLATMRIGCGRRPLWLQRRL
ncbi:hypothetical protein I4F81_010220 [Pyropia yezoensis]|uniref:Uncharacterized protein n=1 Tax=Pyropia yezoensis TaxID=2788 RepID=A0ACC3CD57_PYRYE|nr:hypothetical protein I4F81_010220 [Neopyropia yezoensis]